MRSAACTDRTAPDSSIVGAPPGWGRATRATRGWRRTRTTLTTTTTSTPAPAAIAIQVHKLTARDCVGWPPRGGGCPYWRARRRPPHCRYGRRPHRDRDRRPGRPARPARRRRAARAGRLPPRAQRRRLGLLVFAAMTGRVEAINIAADLEGECRPVEVVEALAGQGLLGDRYFADAPREQGDGRDITLIQAEALEGL